MKRILFLTSTNLACGPRCLKEVELAHELGYEVTVFAFDMDNWTRSIESQIKQRLKNVKYHSLQTARKPVLPWLVTTMLGKAARILYKLGVRSTLVAAISADRRTFSILQALRKRKPKCDLVIAHNPGAFYPALRLSRKERIPFAVDMEDFHPGENNALTVRKAVADVMLAVLPSANYVSFASPLIQGSTLTMLKSAIHDPFVVNNVFPASEFPFCNVEDQESENKLKLVWFSQYINFGRGLDEVLPILGVFGKHLQLTLIGNVDVRFKEIVLDKYDFITLEAPLTQQLLNAELGKHDIGLAIESNNADENRKICLTNKIWAYLQAGLFIWASNTPAQIKFSQRFPEHTAVIDLDNKDAIAFLLEKSLGILPQIRKTRIERWKVNQSVSWESEKKILANKWNIILEN